MPRLLVIDDREQTVDMVQRQLPDFDLLTRCGRTNPCRVCEERDRGCTLRSAHDWSEAEAALREGQLPDLAVLDLHFAIPEEKLLPEEKGDLGTGRARDKAVEQLRRQQGLLILERLRRLYPALPV